MQYDDPDDGASRPLLTRGGPLHRLAQATGRFALEWVVGIVGIGTQLLAIFEVLRFTPKITSGSTAAGTVRALEADAAAGRKPPALTAGVSINAGAVADHLEAGQPPLEAASAAVGAARSRDVLALERANKAFTEAERVATWVAGALENLSGLAGEEGAAGVRRSKQLAGRIRSMRSVLA